VPFKLPSRAEVIELRNQPAKYYSMRRITQRDLDHLSEVAHGDIENFFDRKASMRRIYQKRFLCTALCQGAAIHFAAPKYGYGVKDFDVWSFFIHSNRGTPFGMFRRRATSVAFEKSSFRDKGIDLLWRTVNGSVGDPLRTMQNWLSGNSASARHLSRKAVVMLDPPEYRGQTIWLFGNPA
jgi:hypothetical protein